MQLGEIEKLDDALDDLIDSAEPIKTIASDFQWTEGPAWDAKRQRLLFSDIPANKIYSWSDYDGLNVYLEIAGRVDESFDPDAMPGTNGLWMASSDTLLICNQDARSVDALNLKTMERVSVSKPYKEGPFNSPNDVISSREGIVYFTDPPFGLLDQKSYKGRALPFCGVYRVDADGNAFADVKDMTFPNGLVLTPDERYLYVSQSDAGAPVINRFKMESGGRIGAGGVFYNAAKFSEAGDPGLPDGMTVDKNGNLYATCAGGVVILTPDGTPLGRIRTAKATSNCTFGLDGSTLFITAHNTLLRVQTKTLGLGFGKA